MARYSLKIVGTFVALLQFTEGTVCPKTSDFLNAHILGLSTLAQIVDNDLFCIYEFDHSMLINGHKIN